MQNKKKSFFRALWEHLTPQSLVSKNLFVLISFILFFGISFFLIWERHFRYVKVYVSPEVIAKYQASIDSKGTPLDSSAQLKTPPSLLQNIPSPLLSRLVAAQLIRGVLNDVFSLEDLKRFIRRHPGTPWAKTLGPKINALGEIESYAKLENSLAPSSSSSPKDKSLWKGISETIGSLISVRKVDSKGQALLNTFEEIQYLVKLHDLSGALDLFSKLPSEQKAALSSWERRARARLLLENAEREFLLEMAEGPIE